MKLCEFIGSNCVKCTQVVASERVDRLQSGKTSYLKRMEFFATPLKKFQNSHKLKPFLKI